MKAAKRRLAVPAKARAARKSADAGGTRSRVTGRAGAGNAGAAPKAVAGAGTRKDPRNARAEPAHLPENKERLSVDDTHRTPAMRRGKRGSFP